ncbi:Holliday junction resolvase RuvX [Patescibacteria group bacterium]
MQKGKILGLDWGAKRIGVAVSDEERQMAFGRTSIENKSNEFIISEIKLICDAENIREIVLGYPLNMEGNKTKTTKKVEAFGALLSQKLQITIKYQDERLTSVESDSIITSLDMKKDKRKKESDIIAASLILKNYLDLHREKGTDQKGPYDSP